MVIFPCRFLFMSVKDNKISDINIISALNHPSDAFPAISEVDVKPDPNDSRRFVFEFEPTDEFFAKLNAIKRRELKVEPLSFLYTKKRLYQEIRLMKEAIDDGDK